MSEEWVTGPALELLIQTRGLKEGDRVKVKVARDGSVRCSGGSQDPTSIEENGTYVTANQGKRSATVWHPSYYHYYITIDEVIGWLPKEEV